MSREVQPSFRATMIPAASVLVIIPACNEEESLPAVLSALRATDPSAHVVVVNDGSSDGTAEAAKRGGAIVLSHARNLGYGAALTSGYRYAYSQAHEFVAQLDADGQHDPRQLCRLLVPLRDGVADVVIGSRLLEGGGHETSLPRLIGIRLFSWLGRRLLGRRITDATSGYWAINRKALAFLVANTPEDYPDLNMLVALERLGLRVVEVPVKMAARQAGLSHMRGWMPFLYVPRMLYYVAREYASLRRSRRSVGKSLRPGDMGQAPALLDETDAAPGYGASPGSTAD